MHESGEGGIYKAKMEVTKDYPLKLLAVTNPDQLNFSEIKSEVVG